ncbi:hypothetical protein C0992_009147 [Termitomyces sp. T32_za158]|nr:hypothetical protein C0992_009147 [Termitomyces sp. T32_za158]
MVVWAGGNKGRKVSNDLMAKFPQAQTNKRGIVVDGTSSPPSFLPAHFTNTPFFPTEYLNMKGADGIFAIGDCSVTPYAPTAQVASQEGAYIARMLVQKAKKESLEKKIPALKADLRNATTDEDRKRIGDEIEAAQSQIAKVKLRPFHYSHQGSLA